MRTISILEAPSGLGLEASGVQELSSTLLRLGLAHHIGAEVVGRVEPGAFSGEIDKATGVLNADELVRFSRELAYRVEALLVKGEFPLILGGDCSILLGSALALRRRGRCGLLFLDGHADFFSPASNPNGEAASMDVAFVTGHGPSSLTDLEGYGPSIREEDVVAFGWRDHEDQAEFASPPLPAKTSSFDLPTIRSLGIDRAVDAALDHLTSLETDGFFIHLDADVFDDSVMPAVNYRMAGGLSIEEVELVLARALRTGRAIGLEVTIYNPRLDLDGSAGRTLEELLVRILTP